MANNIEILARNMRLTDNTREHVEMKAAKLERYLQEIDEIRVELSHLKSARSASDRQVAQITVRGKGYILRSEERSEDLTVAFDTAFDKMQRQIERYKGKHYHGRGDGRSAAEVVEEEWPVDETGELLPYKTWIEFFSALKKTKKLLCPSRRICSTASSSFMGIKTNFLRRAIKGSSSPVSSTGHSSSEKNSIQVLYRRRNGSYGLIEPVIG